MPKILYHVTDQKNLGSIKKKGLIPRKDPHLEDKVVNLGSKCTVGMFTSWLVQGDWIQNPVILEVHTENLKLKEIGHGQGWFVSKKKIDPSSIRVTELKWQDLKCKKVSGYK